MIKSLIISNIGPAKKMELTFGERLNLITGDNGLGKSFLLDIIWWTLTRKWPAENNPKLTAGRKALPHFNKNAYIHFTFMGKNKEENYKSNFDRKQQEWMGRKGRPSNPGLVLYAMSDGGFAVWDPSRNYWINKNGVDVQERVPAYVFSPNEVWDGLQDKNGTWLSNGLIRDWSSWQKENGQSFNYLKAALKALSASENEILKPGELTRISLDDIRDIPTIKMPYEQDVAVINASSGMRRIMALAYFLVWAWQEHNQAAKQLGESPTKQITFLIDEIESHLHPSWQRSIVPALLSVMGELAKDTETQLITATHSPLIMTSVEPLFDTTKDAWFDLDFERQEVILQKRDFVKHGEAGSWLTSEAFDLESSRSIEYENLLSKAETLLENENPNKNEIQEMYQKLLSALNPKDDFLFRWRAICNKKGWLK